MIDLFQKTWTLLLFTTMIIVFLFNKLVNSKNSLQSIISDVIRSITTQSLEKLTQLKLISHNNFKDRSLFALIVIWLISISIITKCFSSLLLNMYFWQKSVTLVETLDQLCNKTGMNLATFNFDFTAMIKIDFPEYPHCLPDKFIKYMNSKNYHYLTYHVFDPSVFNDMVEGKIAIILDTTSVQRFESLYFNEKEKYRISERKYKHHVLFRIVYKKSLMRRQMRFW